MGEIAFGAAIVALALAGWLAWRLERQLDERHRQMLQDMHGALTQQSDRVSSRLSEELNRTRETLHRLELSIGDSLATRLDQISSRVNERLEEGFRKTNDTFVNVMQRLTTIDEAQKKIETLTGSVVSLQELLGDKKTRGAFGEVQLEALVKNTLPTSAAPI